MQELGGIERRAPSMAQYFGNAGRQYMQRYGAKAEGLAEIGRISHEHSQRNPYAQFRQNYSLEEILASPSIFAPLTKLQCSPTSDGAAAAVIVSQRFLEARPHLKSQAILMAGQSFSTDSPKAFHKSAIELIGYDMTQRAAQAAMREAGIRPGDVRVCELHDCFSTNELILLDALGFSEPGKAHEMVRRGDITNGGKMVVTPSGGLISKGHPIGATGLAQCVELTWQLRGWANNRLVDTTARGRIGEAPLVANCDPDMPCSPQKGGGSLSWSGHQVHVAILVYMTDNYFIGTVSRVHNASCFSKSVVSHLVPSPSQAQGSDSRALQKDFDRSADEEDAENNGQARNGKHVDMMVTLCHAIFFHKPRQFRADEWLLAEMESPLAGGERGLVVERIWSHEGILVATCIQEGVVILSQPGSDEKL